MFLPNRDCTLCECIYVFSKSCRSRPGQPQQKCCCQPQGGTTSSQRNARCSRPKFGRGCYQPGTSKPGWIETERNASNQRRCKWSWDEFLHYVCRRCMDG